MISATRVREVVSQSRSGRVSGSSIEFLVTCEMGLLRRAKSLRCHEFGRIIRAFGVHNTSTQNRKARVPHGRAAPFVPILMATGGRTLADRGQNDMIPDN